MPVLHVALQEGFSEDTVVIRVEGREIFRKDDVTTQRLLGYADSFETEISSEQVIVDIEVPSRNLSDSMDLQLPDDRYLGVSIFPGKIQSIVSEKPYGYL